MNQNELLKALEFELPYWEWVAYPKFEGVAPIVGACGDRVVVVSKASCLEFKYKAAVPVFTTKPIFSPFFMKKTSLAEWACREVAEHD